eukprot:gnl/Spiro4/21212_TR10352_c0_g2_i1.p1 gnl/Spiro4/21212_TR10352_c0_g2~~gnl/Spiro4/21212_TR10352_c0_g2_i1.p1  ORF type:complete len:153 (+),score=29.09 gnl/Spiro4/21212_TR10352_c0_g2_i1:112-570(+)
MLCGCGARPFICVARVSFICSQTVGQPETQLANTIDVTDPTLLRPKHVVVTRVLSRCLPEETKAEWESTGTSLVIQFLVGVFGLGVLARTAYWKYKVVEAANEAADKEKRLLANPPRVLVVDHPSVPVAIRSSSVDTPTTTQHSGLVSGGAG